MLLYMVAQECGASLAPVRNGDDFFHDELSFAFGVVDEVERVVDFIECR